VTAVRLAAKAGVLVVLACGAGYFTLAARDSLHERALEARAAGVATPATDVKPALPGNRPPSALFVGDGWTAGTGVGPQQSFACLTAAALGWICNNGGQEGTGYLATGPAGERGLPYANRVASYRTLYAADYVVISGGAADAGAPAGRRTAAVRRTFDAVRAAYPDARVVVAGPLVAGDDPSRDLRRLDTVLRAEAARRRWLFVETLDPPWIPTRLVPGLMTKDGDQPTAAGHGHLAGQLVTAIQAAGIHPGELPSQNTAPQNTAPQGAPTQNAPSQGAPPPGAAPQPAAQPPAPQPTPPTGAPAPTPAQTTSTTRPA
jgi:hypothetical protein